MLNKTKIIVAAASLLITGVGAGTGAYIATRNNDTGASSSSEVMSMASSKTESVDTSPIDSAVSAGVEKINETASKAIQDIESKAGQQSKASSAAVSSASKSPLEIPLNVETQRGDGTLTFKLVKTDPQRQMIRFYFSTSKKQIDLVDIKATKLRGKSGAVYSYSGGGQLMEPTEDYNQDMVFEGIADYSDLSRVTLTYAFEGYDPVTITFDIPIQ